MTILKDRGNGTYLCLWVPDTVRECQRGRVVLRLYGAKFRAGEILEIYGTDFLSPGEEIRPLQWQRPCVADAARGAHP